jgi:hypothetical protein
MTNYLHHLHTYLLPLADAPVPPAGGADATVVDPATGVAPATGATTTAVTTAVTQHHSHTGWTIGYILFIVVVLVVVALVVPIIALAGRIGHQAPAINESLQLSQNHTANITALEETIDHARVITAGLYRARARLGG